jgi:hypothetical protein
LLIIEAKVCFDQLSENPQALSNDLDTTNIIRPAINFGNDLLFSGTIITSEETITIIRGLNYEVVIEMPTIEVTEYDYIKDLLNVGNDFTLQAASRVIGKGIIRNSIFI